MPLIPYVLEKSGREERVYDIFSRLLKDRIVFLGTGITDEVANLLVAQLLFLQSEDAKADIHLYVNSPGGSVSAGMAIYDTMQFVTCDVATYCIGQAASMGAVSRSERSSGSSLGLGINSTPSPMSLKSPTRASSKRKVMGSRNERASFS